MPNSKLQRARHYSENIAAFCLMACVLVLPYSMALKNIFMIAGAVIVLCSGLWLTANQSFRRQPVLIGAFLLWLLFTIGLFYTSSDFTAALQVYKKYCRLLFFCLLVFAMRKAYWRKLALHALLFANMVWLLWSVLDHYQLIAVFTHIRHTQSRIISAPLGFFNFWLCICTYLYALYFMEIKHRGRYVYLFGTVLSLFFIIFVYSERTPMLVLPFLSLLFLWQVLPRRWLAMAAILLGLACITLYFSSQNVREQVQRIPASVQHYERDPTFISSIGLRIEFLRVSFHLWAHKPWLGYGTGSFAKEYLLHGRYAAYGQPISHKHMLHTPHNEYANIAVQLGLLGLLLFCGLLLTVFYSARHLPRLEARLARGLAVGFALCCFADSYLFLSQGSTVFIVLLAVVYGAYSPRRVALV